MDKRLREKYRISKLAEKNPNWIGDKVKYHGVHSWINRNYKKPRLCQDCRVNLAYDLANISQEYKRDISDWEWICRRCHMNKDGRLKKLIAHNKAKKNGILKKCDFCSKEMRVIPSRIKFGGGKHCSHTCAMKNRYKKHETKEK